MYMKMQVHDIEDFRETGIYQYVKATEPQNTMPMEQLVRYTHHKYYTKKSCFSTIKNAHKFSSSNACVEIPLGTNAKYDGIYDIWLRNCCGVISITLCFGDVEVPIPEFKLDNDTSIQIPLALCTNGKEVSHIFAHETSSIFPQNHISFIPSIAFLDQKLTIKLNKEGSCDAHISTVYYNNIAFRRILANSTNTFYINGEPYVTTWGGHVRRASDSSKRNGCVIC
jgi:hypothetical protein